MPKKKQKISIKLIYVIISGAILISTFIGLFNFFKVSDYFKIKDVIYFGADDSLEIDDYIEVREKNLFKINLDQIAKDILQRYPKIRKVKVRRIFPDKLRIDIEMRNPIAIIKSKANYLFIDEEGKEIQRTRLLRKTALPIIIGLDSKSKDKEFYSSERLSLTLTLLKTIKEFKDLEGYSITKIDVSDVKNTSFFINYGIQIKIGNDDFKDRLRVLLMILERLKAEIKEIKYIDLRFKEPVIAKK